MKRRVRCTAPKFSGFYIFNFLLVVSLPRSFSEDTFLGKLPLRDTVTRLSILIKPKHKQTPLTLGLLSLFPIPAFLLAFATAFFVSTFVTFAFPTPLLAAAFADLLALPAPTDLAAADGVDFFGTFLGAERRAVLRESLIISSAVGVTCAREALSVIIC